MWPWTKSMNFVNCQFKANLTTSRGKYTDTGTKRSSYLVGGVSRGLGAAFAVKVAGSAASKISYGKKHSSSVRRFIEEYKGDKLFNEITGRNHRHFPYFNARKVHQGIKKPALLKDRSKLDRGRFASASTHQ